MDPASTGLPSGAQLIRAYGPGAESEARKVVRGSGVVGLETGELRASDGGLVRWKVVRQAWDELSMRHVFYRQYYYPPASASAHFPSAAVTDGLPILGTGLGLHYREGKLVTAFGVQFPEVSMANRLVISRADEAKARVVQEIGNQGLLVLAGEGGFLDEPRLVLKPDDVGLRFVWHVLVKDSSQEPFWVEMEAELGVLSALWPANPMDGPCDWGSTTASAIGYRQFGGPLLSLWATADANSGYPRRQGFSHEAHRPAGGGIPEILVLQDFKFEPNSAFGGDNLYWGQLNCPGGFSSTRLTLGVVPVKSVSGTPTYDDVMLQPLYGYNPNSRVIVRGRAAGEALWHTYLTMEAFFWFFQWYGWDGAGSRAVLVVDANAPSLLRNATFDVAGSYGPANAVVFGPEGESGGYGFVSSSLDTVAHEWGHGMAFAAGLPFGEPHQQQLHEGFADVIGYAVEWLMDPNPDWLFQEDYSQGWKRRVDQDFLNGAFHSSDVLSRCQGNDPNKTPEPHCAGNMLGVAYRMLQEGTANPACARLSNCWAVPQGLGFGAAKVLYRTLAYYVDGSTTWGMLNELARRAAFDLYARCGSGYSAIPEQQAVDSAFVGVGLAGLGYYHRCGR